MTGRASTTQNWPLILNARLAKEIATGRYHLISKSHPRAAEDGGDERSQLE
jgi:hypothetical protein